MAKIRPQEKFHKQLKPWKIEAADNGWVKITCPHKECRGVAYVKRGKWLHDKRRRSFIGRSCTYCFKTARVPGDQT